jgi:sec-independent protein translocase protein TatC
MTSIPLARRETPMSVVEHLTELRRRLMISVAAIAIGFVVAFIFSNVFVGFLVDFYRDATDNTRNALIFTGPLDAFAVRLKVAAYGSVVLALPVWLWQLWRFVTPALDKREKRYAIPFVLSSMALFAVGAAVALLTLPDALDFLLHVGGSDQTPLLAADKYVSFVTLIILAFGLSFEFPILVMFLLLARVVSTQQLRSWRRWTAIGVTVFAAVITPSQDPYSLVAMAVPMYLLYEMCILLGRLLKR